MNNDEEVVDEEEKVVNWDEVPEVEEFDFDEVGKFNATHVIRTFEIQEETSEFVPGIEVPVYGNEEGYRTSIHYNDDVYGDMEFKSHEVEDWQETRVDVGAGLSYWYERRGKELMDEVEEQHRILQLIRYQDEDINGRVMEVSYDPENDRFVLWEEVQDTGRNDDLYFQEWESVVKYLLNRLFPVWNIKEGNVA